MRLALTLAEIPYTIAMRWRNRRFDAGRAAVHRLPIPVVSVGNITLGGTGKTPFVEWVARWFSQRGIRVGIVSRGYGAARGGHGIEAQNDEALELERRLPGVPHVQIPDRVEGARRAMLRFGCQAVVLDDAFQHRRLARDLDLCLVDALEPFGYGHVFPRGTLREPVDGLRRADVVVLSRVDLVTAAARRSIRATAARLAPGAAWAEVAYLPQSLVNARGGTAGLAAVAESPVAAFCGVGNPAGFRRTLENLGCRVIAFREFADHYRYTRADIESLIAWADGLDAAAVVCTSKDLVKLGIDRLGSRPLWAVSIVLNFLSGQEAVERKLIELASRWAWDPR